MSAEETKETNTKAEALGKKRTIRITFSAASVIFYAILGWFIYKKVAKRRAAKMEMEAQPA